MEVGETVCEYPGEVVSKKEGDRRWDLYPPGKACFLYFFKYDSKRLCLDPTAIIKQAETNPDFVGALINHSRKSPNVKAVARKVGGRLRIYFVVHQKRIEATSEILYDYGDRDPQSVKHNPWLQDS